MIMPTYTYERILIWLLALTLATSVVFTAFPQLDIATSALFYRDGFWLNEVPFLLSVRQGLIWGMYGFALGVAAVLVYKLLKRQEARRLGFALAVILGGPILLVNVILKSNWGRARPANIVEFGGELSFTPAWLFTDQCHYNCSFTSGEGGAIATTALLIAFFAWPKLRRGRGWLILALTLLVCVGAGLRVAMGRHFLSDTLLSIELCALFAAALYPFFLGKHLKP